MADLSLEVLDGAHFTEIGLHEQPEACAGFALRDEHGNLRAMGGLWFISGRAVATFWSCGPPPRRVHRLAIKIIDAARQAGLGEILAEEDRRIPGARKWLERFGFEPFGESRDRVPLWRLSLNEPGDDDPHGGRRGN